MTPMPHIAQPLARTAVVRQQLQAALRAFEKSVPHLPDHAVTGFDVKTLYLGRRKGYVVRIVHGEHNRPGRIIREWRPFDEAGAARQHLLVMQAIAALSGFGGVVASSQDTDTPLEASGADWSKLI